MINPFFSRIAILILILALPQMKKSNQIHTTMRTRMMPEKKKTILPTDRAESLLGGLAHHDCHAKL
jgi:hypothetical protein